MPRSLKVCTTKDCIEITRGGKCDDCKRKAAKARTTNTANYSGNTAWRTKSASFLRRYPVCFDCGDPAQVVDHIDGLGPSGPRGFDDANLQSLCRSCHGKKTARQDGAFGRYYADGHGHDG